MRQSSRRTTFFDNTIRKKKRKRKKPHRFKSKPTEYSKAQTKKSFRSTSLRGIALRRSQLYFRDRALSKPPPHEPTRVSHEHAFRIPRERKFSQTSPIATGLIGTSTSACPPHFPALASIVRNPIRFLRNLGVFLLSPSALLPPAFA